MLASDPIKHMPLARRMAPEHLDDIVGQEEILAPGKLLRRMIEADRLRSIILFGPPGTGKTSIARVIARQTRIPFRQLNAVQAGVAELKRVVEESRNPFITPEGRCLLFIDEIHRFNKAQQDLLLPHVEDGLIILIGATTENPFFEVNKALISRSTVFQLKPLQARDIELLLERALKREDWDLDLSGLELEPGALRSLAEAAAGDARRALGALELALLTSQKVEGRLRIDRGVLADCIQERSLAYDKDGEAHYDTVSAMIKSMRGSDPDAALYYLARALHGGEPVEFVARRILICAAEDVGLANPNALLLAQAAFDAAHVLGMPEARIPLAEACIYVATSPKSNSAYQAIDRALEAQRRGPVAEIPYHLRNAPVEGMRDLGYAEAYRYPHDYPGHIVRQAYLPEALAGQRFYEAGTEGYEARIAERLDGIRRELERRERGEAEK